MATGENEIISGPNIYYSLPILKNEDLENIPVELKEDRVNIDDHSRMPDVVLMRGEDKFLCWINYRPKSQGRFWRIAKVYTGQFVDPGDLYQEDPLNIHDLTTSDNVSYDSIILTWPYGIDSYNFNIDKINEYPFRLKMH